MNRSTDPHSMWPWAIAGALAFVVLAYVVMIRLSLTHPSVPAATDHYADAARYDEILAERKAAAALGWDVDVGSCEVAVAADRCRLLVRVRDRTRAPIAGLTGSIDARRPDDAALDRHGPITDLGEGLYEASLAIGRSGVYALELRLHGGEGAWVGVREASLEVVP